MNINSCVICGRLTRAPELKALPNGTQVVNISIATNSRFKDKTGTVQDRPEFHSIIAFGAVAENAAKYLTKGQICAIQGRLQTRSWESNGEKRYKTEIVADNIQFGPRAVKEGVDDIPADDGNQDAPKANFKATTRPLETGYMSKKPSEDDPDKIAYPTEQINANDIPF